ncbi:hypothetical protein [Kineococcus rhizosphaerae]|uniref:Uncharacterized protein n=1 Tax=Kineococcus rhizosphaerae TaxID=559628 RepID=A0A2T0RB35_9ACTN|nr:hypothetical protein [Kineococcus rhizosphaerae]PRY18386.1 hypothetical protein CLV37_101631 [Kineococcus rhizosphaerae]
MNPVSTTATPRATPRATTSAKTAAKPTARPAVPSVRRAQHRAAPRTLPARRVPRAVELGDAESGVVLASVLAGLRAIPDQPAVDVRTRVREAVRAVCSRIDVAGLALVGGAGAAASVVLTLLVVLWLSSSGRLG